jgi:large subunit ribosomal protein L19
MKQIDIIEKEFLKGDISPFRVGDIVKVSQRVVEGDKTRTQIFEGIVIRRRGHGIGSTFTVLKESKGSSDTVEKTFPLHSPNVEKVKVIKSTKVRRAKLYHLRKKTTFV